MLAFQFMHDPCNEAQLLELTREAWLMDTGRQDYPQRYQHPRVAIP